MENSLEFKVCFSDEKYDNIIKTFHGRSKTNMNNLFTPLCIAYLRGVEDLKIMIYPVYYEYLKRLLQNKYKGNKLGAH